MWTSTERSEHLNAGSSPALEACGFLGQSPERSLRQSLNRRKPTRCRLNYKKQKKVVLYYKVISEQKSAPLTLSLIKCNPAKSVAILRQ